MPGYALTKVDLDNRMGAAILNLRQALAEIDRINAMLNDSTILPDATLQAAPLSYTPTETALIRAAFTDLAKLSSISRAAATQSGANDFWFSAKHLTGLN